MTIQDNIRLEQSGVTVDVTVEKQMFSCTIRPLDSYTALMMNLTDDDVHTLCSFLERLRTKAAQEGQFFVEGWRSADGYRRDVLLSVGPLTYPEAERVWRDESFRHVDEVDVSFHIVPMRKVNESRMM